MNFIDLLWHLSDFLALPLLLGVISAAVAKLLWRVALKHVAWLRLAGYAAGASVVAAAVGLVATGSDGHMLSYACMVLACAASISWCARNGPLG